MVFYASMSLGSVRDLPLMGAATFPRRLPPPNSFCPPRFSSSSKALRMPGAPRSGRQANQPMIHVRRRLVAQRSVPALLVVELKVPPQPFSGLRPPGVVMQENLFILHRPPQLL